MTIGELADKVGVQFDASSLDGIANEVGRGLSAVDSSLRGFNERFSAQTEAVAEPLKQLGEIVPGLDSVAASISPVALAVEATVLAIQGIATATETFIRFEEAMQSVRRATGASAEEMERLNEATLSAAETSVLSTAEVAAVQVSLADEGLSVNEIIAEMPLRLQAVAEEAAATRVDFEGLGGAVAEFGSRMEVAQIRFIERSGINDILEDAVRVLTDVLPPLVQGLGTLFEAILAPIRRAVALLRLPASILGGVIAIVGELVEALRTLFIPDLERVFGIVYAVAEMFQAVTRVIVLGIRVIAERAGGLVQTLMENVTRFIEPVLQPLREAFGFIGRLVDRVAAFLGRTELRLQEELTLGRGVTGAAIREAPALPEALPAVGQLFDPALLAGSGTTSEEILDRMVPSVRGAAGDVHIDMPISVNVSGVEGEPDEIGEAVAERVGDEVRSRFAAELRQLFIDAEF